MLPRSFTGVFANRIPQEVGERPSKRNARHRPEIIRQPENPEGDGGPFLSNPCSQHCSTSSQQRAAGHRIRHFREAGDQLNCSRHCFVYTRAEARVTVQCGGCTSAQASEARQSRPPWQSTTTLVRGSDAPENHDYWRLRCDEDAAEDTAQSRQTSARPTATATVPNRAQSRGSLARSRGTQRAFSRSTYYRRLKQPPI